MKPLENIRIVQGDKVVFPFYVVDDDGLPVDTSDWDKFKVIITRDASNLVITETINSNSSIVERIGSATLGAFQVTIGTNDTLELSEGKQDMQIKLSNLASGNPRSDVFDDIVTVVAKLAEPSA